MLPSLVMLLPTFILLTAVLLPTCSSLHVLVLHPMYAGSHVITLHSVATQLLTRGHRVTTVKVLQFTNDMLF